MTCWCRRIVGESQEPLPIKFIPDNRENIENRNLLPIAKTANAESLKLQTMCVLSLVLILSLSVVLRDLTECGGGLHPVCRLSRLYNIDLDEVIRRAKNFIPSSVITLYVAAMGVVAGVAACDNGS